MKIKFQRFHFSMVLLCSICFISCLTSKKMDAYVASQYGNELPKPRKTKADVTMNSVFPSANNSISTTIQKTSHFLPLIVYFQYDYRHTCTLNPLIGVTQFTNTVNSQSAKLSQKLNGQTLELTVEQVPSAFAIVDKGHLLLLTISWDKIYVEPDFKDLIVSFKLLQNGTTIKNGKIDIRNREKEKGIRLFQSWKSSIREYISSYNSNMTTMSKDFMNQLFEQL
jgi:hypothetical protein